MVNLDSHEKYFLQLEEQQQLSFGKYTTDELIIYFAQQKFMLAIAIEVPECLDELKQIYRNNYSLLNILVNKTGNKYPSPAKVFNYNEGAKLQELLIKWCENWSIHEVWIIENALVALFSWYNNPDLIDQIYWYNNPVMFAKALESSTEAKLQMEKDPEYPKSLGNYTPFHRSRAEYNQSLQSYMNEVDEMYERYGFKKTKEKKGDPQKHFSWLVQYQLLRWNLEKIILHSGNEDLSNDSVKKEIRKIARLIGLNLL